jgi:hypothetical protein
VKITIKELNSREELIRLAITLRNDLFDYEDKLGSRPDFAELKNSAGALIGAILEPAEFQLSANPPKRPLRRIIFSSKKGRSRTRFTRDLSSHFL